MSAGGGCWGCLNIFLQMNLVLFHKVWLIALSTHFAIIAQSVAVRDYKLRGISLFYLLSESTK